ncbi:MAG: hypothetical protein Kow0037_26770 [Calditrichia bacterium]
MTKKFFLLLLLLALITTLLTNCSDKPLDLESDLISNTTAILKDTTLYPIADTTYALSKEIQTDFAERLFLGSFEGLTARPIFRFTDIPDSVSFLSARLRMLTIGSARRGQPAGFTATIYPVLSVWESNLDSVWNDYAANVDYSKTLGQFEVKPSANDTIDIPFTNEGVNLLTQWSANYDDTDQNPGFTIDFTAADFLQYYYSRNSSEFPRLVYTYQVPNDTTVYTDSSQATFDAYIFDFDYQPAPDRNTVTPLVMHNTLLKFDLEAFLQKFPDGVDIVSANLQLFVDHAQSHIDSVYKLNLEIRPLESDITTNPPVIDSTSTRYALFSSWNSDSSAIQVPESEYRITLARSFIQSQLNDIRTNADSTANYHGIAVRFRDQINQWSFFSFYKRQHPQYKPRLILKYQEPVEPRF